MKKSKRLIAMCLMLILSLVAAPLNVVAAGTAKVPVQKISLSSPEYGTLTLEKGKSRKVSVKVEPSKAQAKITWKSSNTKVVTVSKSGTVKGISNGTAKVVGTANDGSKKKVTLQVTVGKPVTAVTVLKKSLTVTQGQTATIKPAVKPSNASNKKLQYLTSDSKIAVVSSAGKITGVKAGKAVITVKATDGSTKSAKVTVTVKAKSVNRILTEKDVVNGTILVSDITYGKLVIAESVGKADIVLSNVTVTEVLEMEPGAEYKVISRNSNIKKVVSLEEDNAVVKAFAAETSAPVNPTFIAEAGTVIISVDARGNVSIKQESNATIGAITVTRKLDGKFEMNLEGFQGNLVVNTQSNASIDITTKDCKIPEATISGIAAGQILSLKDALVDGKESSIGKISVETNAKLKLNIPAEELVISEKASSPSVSVNEAVGKITNNGSGTKLEINSNVNNIVSTGKALDLTVAAGSTVKNLESSGAEAKIEIALGSTVEKVTSKGDNAKVFGDGKVTEAKVEGNNTKIDTAGTTVTVGEGVSGVTAGGQHLQPGSSNTSGTIGGSGSSPTTPSVPGGDYGTNPGTDPGTDPGTNPGTNPETPATGTKITIDDPGVVWAGAEVQIKADKDDIVWSAYGYIDDTNGYAWIEEATGVLHAYSPGTVRVVATSKTNSSVYGAVDLTIRGKKFVKSIPINNTIIIENDEGLIDTESLEGAGKLPKEVQLVYETGNGNETEIITISLSNDGWYGDYNGGMEGLYTLKRYISVPAGYERPTDLIASVLVEVKLPQTDNRIRINGFKPVDTIVLDEDKNLVSSSDLYREFFSDKTLTAIGNDGKEYDFKVNGYYLDEAHQFNGAVPGNYSFAVDVRLKGDFKTYNETMASNYVYWYEQDYMKVTVPIQVSVAQTGKTVTEIKRPNTTQPRFTIGDTTAKVIEFTFRVPEQAYTAGTVIDFSQYLTISADTQKESDKLVVWLWDGNGNMINNLGNGRFVLQGGKHTITVVSTIDKSKTASITIDVQYDKLIVSYKALNKIVISEDLNIIDFSTGYNAVKDLLPSYATAIDSNGKELRLPITGWYYTSKTENALYLRANVIRPSQYSDSASAPEIEIDLLSSQSDNRVRVVTGSAIQSKIRVDTDLYATEEYYLVSGLYDMDKDGIRTILINVLLENGTSEVLKGTVENYWIKNLDTPNRPYDGVLGNYLLTMNVLLPSGYRYEGNLLIQQEVSIEVSQYPRYENIWVTQVPKLNYHAGEKLDLSGLLISLNDSTYQEDNTRITIQYSSFATYGIVLRTQSGIELTSDALLDSSMNGTYIYIYDTQNYSCFFGPLTIIE